MNFPVIALAALAGILPLSGFAQEPALGCLLDGVPVEGEVIEGDASANTIDCSSSDGPHKIYGYGGSDTLIGSKGDDFIAGGGNNDFIYGRGGHDAIDGGAADDIIYGESGHDTIFGGVGSAPASGVGCTLQTAFIALGSSYLTKGGSGDDIIFGGDGNDCIDAGSGEDFVYGGDGNDTLEGGNHSDMLYGGPGTDYLDGGWHTDTCVGGGYPEDNVDEYRNCESVDSISKCDNGTCDIWEDSCNCPEDCGETPTTPALGPEWCDDTKDNDCDGQIDCDDADCAGNPILCPDSDPPPPSSSECPNNVCEAGEDCITCPQDCSGKQKGKLSKQYCCGNGIQEAAEENGSVCDGNH